RIDDILSPIVGNGNVRDQVSAQLDVANKERTEEHYSPNGDASKATLRSRQLNSSEQVGAGYPGGVPGALSNQPARPNEAPNATPPTKQQNAQNTPQPRTTTNSNRPGPRRTKRNETSNYAAERTILHQKKN
ncbi:flagellar M-ring protein FliF C-terminal domain-containing protein, partial [Salmonella enterica]|uniref:flagellar M-ring protein FliF C-terminal domain-containing protein n=1 Tax=Salmonella enterica TaxID=28901 RepID=UPI00398C24E0